MKTVIALILLLCLFSCTSPRYMYSPSAQNIPVFKQAGDSKAGIYYSDNLPGERTIDGTMLKEHSSGMDVHAAYAITNSVALQFNYFSRDERQEERGWYGDSGRLDYSRSLFEIGVGLFKPLDSKQNDMKQVFAGVGFGKTSFTDIGSNNGFAYNRFLNTNVLKIYLQPALLFRTHKLFSYYFTSRFTYISFSNTTMNYDSANRKLYNLADLDGDGFFWEPSITTSFGIKQLPGLRAELQLSMSDKLNDKVVFNHRKTNFSMGLAIDMRKLLARKQ